ncbi:hypothetical protein [Rhodocaloribacter sp.]
MSAAHVHLLLNHVPILGILFGTLLLAFALWRKKPELVRLSLGLFVFTGLVAIVVYLTGEGAEELVEHGPGVSESLIEAHEDAALFAFIAALVLGAASLAALFVRDLQQRLAPVVLALAVVTSGLMVWTGAQGGQINHPEIRSDTAVISAPGSDTERGADDDAHEEPEDED